MEPQVNNGGKGGINRARGPADVTIWTKHGPQAVPGPRWGSWDPDAHEALTPAPGKEITALAVAAVPGTTPPQPGKRIGKAQRRRERLTQVVLALRAQGESVQDIAARLAVSPATITGWLSMHRRDMQVNELDELLDRIAVPLATENLIHGLIAGDKDYTLETLKGRGALKRHSEGDGKPPTTLPELVIRFEAPGGNLPAPSAHGQILGAISVPKPVEGSVVSSVPNAGPLQPVPAIPRPTPALAGARVGGEVPGGGTGEPGADDEP
jgi:transcriptional regulator with XRE-family HTH domain